jgi:hypothetical protein
MKTASISGHYLTAKKAMSALWQTAKEVNAEGQGLHRLLARLA